MIRTPLSREILDDRVIAIARRVPGERLAAVADILRECGVRSLEVTLDSTDAFDAIRSLASQGQLVGAGTVRRPEQVAEAADAGAHFVVSPHTDPGVVASARELGLPVMAGAMTPTEAANAWDLGVSAVKLFPANVGGPGFLRSLRGPLADVTFVPTGGIDADNAAAYLDAGAAAVGVGGWLTAAEDVDTVAARASAVMDAVRTAG